MPLRLLTLPVRVGVGVVRFSLRLAGRAVGFGDSGSNGSSPTSTTADRTAEPSRSPAETGDARDGEGRSPAPASPPAPATKASAATEPTQPSAASDRAEPSPISPSEEAAKTIDDEPVVVAEFAEPGAEDGAGAEVDVDEPWPGYSGMAADAVVDRLTQLDAPQLAVVELYERSHKNRETVLDAAERRLRSLTPPGGASAD